MKKLIYATIIAAIFAAGCTEDIAISGSITFANDGLYVEELGESISTTFTYTNVISLEVDDYPDGWEVEASLKNATVTVHAPTSIDDDLEGLVLLTGYTESGYSVVRAINVGIKKYVSLESSQSNCIVVNTADRVYTINPRRMGEETAETLEEPTSCEIVWQSENYPIQHVHLNSKGELSFYTTVDEDDLDEDGSTTDVIDGNAVVYAKRADGTAIWSWHIWVSEDSYGEITVDGNTFMDRNLGALMNDNSSTSNIGDSYGMYYQWGRKDPFNAPAYYNAAGGIDGNMTDQYDGIFEYRYVDSLYDSGTMTYATYYPWRYIASTEQTNHDWLYGSDNTLWGGTSGSKSIYDPCPQGWEMPTSAMFENFAVDASQTILDDGYGLTLSGGNLFMCYGFRTYYTGRIQNINENYEPWVGYYWTRDTEGEYSKAMAIKWTDTAVVGIENSYRANGMQVRCVKR